MQILSPSFQKGSLNCSAKSIGTCKKSCLCAQATSLHPLYILPSSPLYSVLSLYYVSTESLVPAYLSHIYCCCNVTHLTEFLLRCTREDTIEILMDFLDPLQLNFLQVKAWIERGEPASKKSPNTEGSGCYTLSKSLLHSVHPVALRGLEPMETCPGREARYCREVWVCLPTTDSCVSEVFARIFTRWGLGESRSSI